MLKLPGLVSRAGFGNEADVQSVFPDFVFKELFQFDDENNDKHGICSTDFHIWYSILAGTANSQIKRLNVSRIHFRHAILVCGHGTVASRFRYVIALVRNKLETVARWENLFVRH